MTAPPKVKVGIQERIATNILSTRLKWLEKMDVVSKHKLTTNKQTNIYILTESGIGLAPMISEMMAWSELNLKSVHAKMNDFEMSLDQQSKVEKVKAIQDGYRAFVAAFPDLIV